MGDTNSKQIDQRYQEPCRVFEHTTALPPGGVTKARVAHVPGRHPIYMDRARGAHVWDVDGNEYFDWMSGCSCILLGYPPFPFIQFALADEKRSEQAKRTFYAEVAARGVYFHPNHHWFVNLSHTPVDVARTLEACEAALKVAEESIDCRA